MGVRTNDLDSQLVVLMASAANGIGTGSLVCSGSSLTYTPPGGSAGTTVTIADGAMVKVCGADTTQYLVVIRDGSDDLSGTAQILTDGLRMAREDLVDVQDAIARTLQAVQGGEGDVTIMRERLSALQAREQLLKSTIAVEDTLAGAETSNPTLSYPDFSGGW